MAVLFFLFLIPPAVVGVGLSFPPTSRFKIEFYYSYNLDVFPPSCLWQLGGFPPHNSFPSLKAYLPHVIS